MLIVADPAPPAMRRNAINKSLVRTSIRAMKADEPNRAMHLVSAVDEVSDLALRLLQPPLPDYHP
jgi:hypothetical protein